MPKAGEVYRHFKGNLYKVICEARHSETEEKMVVYQALYGDYQIYVRPFSSFISAVDYNKYPDATQSMRFELVSPVVDVAEIEPVGRNASKADDTAVTSDKARKEAEVKAKEQTVNAIKANGNRPLENGNMANASAVTSIDFRNMNLEQIRAYAEAERRKR